MKKVLLTLVAVIVIVGALAGAGFAGYRIGYAQGANNEGSAPAFGRFYHMDPDQMPMQRFGNDFGPRFQQNRSSMMGRGGIGFATPFHFLWNIVVLGLIAWFVYWLFNKSGWRITRTTEDTAPKTEGN